MQKELLAHYRLSVEEYQSIEKKLRHSPSRLELALFSALWSEHCSYKSTSIHLKKLYFDSPKVLSSFGENAGVVDIGQEEKVAFKVESHNHPSQISPYHGAGTGVGGILRDIFVMNARPVALANYLCFGSPDSASTPSLVDGVVRGIGDYGNCMGIPTITGQTEFHPSYNENVIVNAFALGYFGPKDSVMTSKPWGSGNLLVYAGSQTGRDGIHGASMASESFTEKSHKNKETCVQIGDPFYGKLLMESCLEVMKKKLIVSAQDMGAAGLISSSFEMLSKGKMGMDLHLDRVPLRDSSMSPEDILLSETQERVLFVVQPDKWDQVQSIFTKWGLPSFVLGKLKEERSAKLFWRGKQILQIDPSFLTDEAPCYKRPFSSWKALHRTKNKENTKPAFNKQEASTVLLSILSDSRACTRQFIYGQYDQTVGAKTIRDASFPIAVIRLPSSGRFLALCFGGRPHIMRMDSLEGGKDSIYEPALQLASRGFEPLAFTDGLNFGSPENKTVMTELVACIEGMAQASRSLKTPIVSGNVSLYNETKGRVISSTPVTTLIGVKDSLDMPKASLTGEAGHSVYVLSAHQVFHKGLMAEKMKEKAPFVFYGSLEPKICKNFMETLWKVSQMAPPESLRVVGKFGLLYTLARKLLYANLGMKLNIPYDFFQERLYELVLVLTKEQSDIWKESVAGTDFQLEKIGETISEPRLLVNHQIDLPNDQLRKAYESGWNRSFQHSSAHKLVGL